MAPRAREARAHEVRPEGAQARALPRDEDEIRAFRPFSLQAAGGPDGSPAVLRSGSETGAESRRPAAVDAGVDPEGAELAEDGTVLAVTREGVAQENIPRQPSVTLPSELDRVLRDYELYWRTGNSEALSELFTEGGYVPSEKGWLKGRKAIQNKYDGSGGDLKLRALSFGMSGDIGFIVGAYGYNDQADTIDRGNFVLALRKNDAGRWLIVADLDKSNRP